MHYFTFIFIKIEDFLLYYTFFITFSIFLSIFLLQHTFVFFIEKEKQQQRVLGPYDYPIKKITYCCPLILSKLT